MPFKEWFLFTTVVKRFNKGYNVFMKKHIPNFISLIRIILIPVLFVLFYFNQMIACAAFFGFLALTDSLDGYVARKYNLVTNAGKFIDPIADKILDVAGMILIAVQGILDPYSAGICFTLLIGRDFLISGFRLLAMEKRVVISADLWGKMKTFILDFAIPALLLSSISVVFLYIGMALLYASTLVSLFSAGNYIYKNKEVLK